MIDIRILNKLVNNWVRDLIDNGELNVTEDGYIYYTQSWINEKLFQEWLLEEGYSTKELMIILECFENFKREIDFFIEDIIDEKYDKYTQEVYTTYDEIYYTLQAVTKKIESRLNY